VLSGSPNLLKRGPIVTFADPAAWHAVALGT
jgi:hypothetical protein